jgi:sugar lactone lactonase YvrE
MGVAVGPDGSVYVADTGNNKIRKIANGTVSTVAGTGGLAANSTNIDGPCTSALFSGPTNLAVDQNGTIYVADSGDNVIRKITNSDSAACAVSTLAGQAGAGGYADGMGSSAQFSNPTGLTLDATGNVYVTDSGHMRKITPAGVVTTIVTSGVDLNAPWGIAIDGSGNLYVSESLPWIMLALSPTTPIISVDGIIKITLSGTVNTWTGSEIQGLTDGVGASAGFSIPCGMAFGPDGALYVADTGNDRIRRITPDAQVTTIAGTTPPLVPGAPDTVSVTNGPPPTCSMPLPAWDSTTTLRDGPADQAVFNSPEDVAVDASGAIYVADRYNNAIRKITPQ